MDRATLSRFLLDRPAVPPPAWAVVLCLAALLVVAACVLVVTGVVDPPDPDLTGSWRWLAPLAEAA